MPPEHEHSEMRPAVFLDRDGVLNHGLVRNGRPYAPEKMEEFVLISGVEQAVSALREAGYLAIVATNQPDVGGGRQRREVVEAMHEIMRAKVPIDAIEVCYHVDRDGCECRKPKPGMLLHAARQHGIDLARSWMIGDRWRDVAAGQAAGCRTVFVDYGYDEPRPEHPDVIVKTLAEAVPFLLGKMR
ncbi:MAG: family hydrolase [Xanthobacteraceae bacterium]|nr:family hydrolase [Xanthobacteraceae bacterium]